MRTRSVLPVAAGLTLALALAGCGGDDTSSDTGSDSSLIPPETVDAETTASSTETRAPTETATTGPSAPTGYTAAAVDAVNELEAAWKAGDQARARAIAPGDVVDALFVVPPDGFAIQGCDTGELPTSTCNLRNRATEAFIVVTAARSDAGWQIATIDVNAD